MVFLVFGKVFELILAQFCIFGQILIDVHGQILKHTIWSHWLTNEAKASVYDCKDKYVRATATSHSQCTSYKFSAAKICKETAKLFNFEGFREQ